MHRRGHAIPAENHDPEKSRLRGKGKHRFKTQDIANEVSVAMENGPQPNANSIDRPDTTPMPKLSTKMRVQKRDWR